ncbi:MAG: hypothetical protein AAF389_00275 [Gemmatimonadota bacterium]
MSDLTWDRLGAIAPHDLVSPTLELHWAAQYLASIGQTFAKPAEDDSHRAMSWDADLRAFVSAPMAGPYPFRAALRPTDTTLLLIDRTGAELGALPLAGVRRDEGYEWLATGLATYLGGAPPSIGRPDYDMPSHAVSSGAEAFSEPTAGPSLEALYDAAADTLHQLANRRPDASDILCWPHHFDIATLLTVDDGSADGVTKTVGVGMAPMGGGYDTWYWYVTPYPYPAHERLGELSGPGRWHTEGWTGAVLQGSDVVAAPPEEREGLVRAFVDEAIESAVEALRSD